MTETPTSDYGTVGIVPYLKVARIDFLALSVVLVALGMAAASLSGPINIVHTGLALLGLAALHISVNSLNEYSDFVRGIDLETDKTPFSGGSGTLPENRLPPENALYLGLTMAGIGAIIGIYFLWVIGWLLLPIVVIGAICVLLYTDFLARIGLGEIAAGFGLGALPVIGVALVQDGQIGLPAVVASIPAFFLTFNLLLLNEFPDIGPDRRGGRTNLIHLLGRHRAGIVYTLAGIAVPVVIIVAVVLDIFPVWGLLGVLGTAALYRPAKWALRQREEVPIHVLRDNVLFVLASNGVLAMGLLVPIVLG